MQARKGGCEGLGTEATTLPQNKQRVHSGLLNSASPSVGCICVSKLAMEPPADEESLEVGGEGRGGTNSDDFCR